jgi:hypothetical protein
LQGFNFSFHQIFWKRATIPVGQGRHFHAEYLFILRKLVSAEAKNRIIMEDSCFHHTKNNFFENLIFLKFWHIFLELFSADPALLVRYTIPSVFFFV